MVDINDTFFEDKIKLFISRNFPVKRIKDKGKFKRALVFNNEIYFLSENKSDEYIDKIVDILELIFKIKKTDIRKIVINYFS